MFSSRRMLTRRWLLVSALLVILPCVLGLAVTQAQQPASYVTPYDTVPNFALNPTRTTVQAGPWSTPATWSGGQVPGLTDVVRIIHPVTYASMTGRALRIGIETGGSLTFSLLQSTKLDVGTLFVAPGGKLEIGTVANPLPPQFTAEIMIRDIPLDTAGIDPHQHGTGLLVLDGTITLLGAPRTPTFTRLTTEPQADFTTLSTADAVVGWRAGDELVLPDSRQATDYIAMVQNSWQWETPTLTTNVTGTGTVLVITPLQYGHPGARSSLTNSLDFTPHVGNLSRNIVIKSENPAGTRGHVWITRRSSQNIQYTRFQDLGRTTTAALSATNQVGRYALHMHHLMGPPYPHDANEVGLQGYQFVLKGNVVHGGATEHTRKWAYTIHDSHYGLIEDNIAYNCAGACFMTEEGNETSNVFNHNFAVRATGVGGRMSEGSEATGFWFRGPNNIVKNNVAASIPGNYPGLQNCGYSIWQQYAGNVKIPNYPGADTSVTGQYTLTSIYSMPIKEFANNEAYGSACGMTTWWLGSNFMTPVATQDSVIKNLSTWNIYSTTWINYHSHRQVLDGWVTRGNPAGTEFSTAYAGLDYTSSEFTIKNSDIQGVGTGVFFSTDTRGTQRIENSRIVSSGAGIVFGSQWASAIGFIPFIPPRTMVIDMVELIKIPSSPHAWKSIATWYNSSNGHNLIAQDTMTVVGYQKQPGVNLSVYYAAQAPSFIVPQTVIDGSGTVLMVGSPTAGLTNAQNWAQHGIAIAGAVAPCADTTTRPEIGGITCVGSGVPPPPPPPPPTTSCQMSVPSCPNFPTVAGEFNDSFENSDNNQARCMLRAQNFYDWCAATTAVTARYFSGTTLLQTAVYPPPEWTSCAQENGQCAFTGTKEVRYGANGTFATQILTNGTPCTNAVFGDPIVGTVKQCEFRTPGGTSGPDQTPIGNLDFSTCETLYGWALDQDTPSLSINVHLYDGAYGAGGVFIGGYPTNWPRPDVNTYFGITGIHGYSIPTPASLKNGAPHSIYVYGINSNSAGVNIAVSNSGMSLTCPAP